AHARVAVPEPRVPGHAAEIPPARAVGGDEAGAGPVDDLQRLRARLRAPGVEDARGLAVAEGVAHARALASLQTAANSPAIVRACASVMISGGEKRIVLLPHSSTSRPRRKQRSAIACAISGVASSTPIIRPTPRTSVTAGSPRS